MKGNEMRKPVDYPGTFGQWYQEVVKPLEDAITPDVRKANAASHVIGIVDDCYRCLDCEIGSWNAWKQPCF
jgi:hypothetical protein